MHRLLPLLGLGLLPLLALVVGLVAAPRAAAQSAYDCVPYPDQAAFPPDPHPDPYPDGVYDAAPNPDAESQTAARAAQRPRAASVFRRAEEAARRGRRSGPSATARGGNACPTEELDRQWDGTEWEDSYRTRATYDAAGRTLSITEGHDTGGGIEDYYREEFTYDAQGRMTSSMYLYAPEGEEMEPESRGTYAYDAQGRLSEVTEEVWTGTAWAPEYHVELAFGAGPYLTGFVTDEWDGTGWMPDFRGTFTYDGLLMTEGLYEQWNGTTWMLDERETLDYDGAGRLTEATYEYADEAEVEPQYRYLFTYDGAGRVVTERGQEWSGEWVDYDLTEYAYDAGGQLGEAVYSYHNGGGFEPSWRERFEYEGGHLSETLSDTYSSGTWDMNSRLLVTRDGQHRPVERTWQFWEGGAWQNSRQDLFAYGGSVGAEDSPQAAALALTAAPNPVRETATLRYDLAAPAVVRLAVYDVLGRRVAVLANGARAAGPNEVTLDAGRLAPGVYLVRLEAGEHALTRRVTVVR